MALSPEEKRRQEAARNRVTNAAKSAKTRRDSLLNSTRTRMRAEAEAKAKKERQRLQKEGELKQIWGGGKAAAAKTTNDLAYVEKQRVKTQNAIGTAEGKKTTPTPPKPTAKPTPKPVPKPAAKPVTKPAANTTTRPASPPKPAAKPAAKPADKVPAPAAPKERRVSAATANRESGNYGTSRTNNPLMADLKEAMKRREEKQAGTQGSSSASDRSKYVAPNGQQYAGPAFGNGTSANSKPVESALNQKSGSEKLADAVKKQQDDEKKRRDNLVTRRPGTSKPGSTY